MLKGWAGKAAAAALAAATAGCTTAPDPITRNAPLKLAMTEPVESLRQRSDAGDRQAQYALSFLMRTGLRGVERDPVAAEGLRARAGQAISRSTAVYVPGGNGRPGHVMMVPVTDPGVSDSEARRLDTCGLALLLGQPAMGGVICGSPAAYIDLLPGAVTLRQELMSSALAGLPAVDPASVADCAATGDLWSDAALRMGLNDHAAAGAAADRIIELCGEGEESWHARVMRAQIALDAGDPALALATMEPVPLPAPAPVGGYASLVVMSAHAMRGDWPAYAAERDRLTAASLAALDAEPEVRRLDAFPVAGGEVVLLQRPAALTPMLDAHMVALVKPGNPEAAPRAFWVTSSPDLVDPDGRSWFLDEYRCDGRATLQMFTDGAPTPATVRQAIEARMAGRLEPVSGSGFASGSDVCQFPAMVAPGLGDDPLVVARQAAAETASATEDDASRPPQP